MVYDDGADSMSEAQARQWIEHGLERWPRGLAPFAPTVAPLLDECIGQIGIQFLDFAMRRAEAFYWLDRGARGRGIAVEALNLVTEWAFRHFLDIVRLLNSPRTLTTSGRRGSPSDAATAARASCGHGSRSRTNSPTS